MLQHTVVDELTDVLDFLVNMIQPSEGSGLSIFLALKITYTYGLTVRTQESIAQLSCNSGAEHNLVSASSYINTEPDHIQVVTLQ